MQKLRLDSMSCIFQYNLHNYPWKDQVQWLFYSQLQLGRISQSKITTGYE